MPGHATVQREHGEQAVLDAYLRLYARLCDGRARPPRRRGAMRPFQGPGRDAARLRAMSAARTGTPRRVLIIRLSALGDVVMASGLIPAVRAVAPDAHLAWLVEPAGAPLLRHNPRLDEVIVLPRPEWEALWRAHRWVALARSVWRFRRALRERRFELALDAQGLLKSALVRVVERRAASHQPDRPRGQPSPRHRAGAAGARPAAADRRRVPRAGTPPRRAGRCLPHGSRGRRRGARAGAREARGRRRHRPLRGAVPLHHAAAEALVRRALGRARHAAGRGRRAAGAAGRPDDAPRAGSITGHAPDAVDLVGKLKLDETVAAIADAALLVGVDTGLAHMGTALDVPTIALFGSTRPYLDARTPRTVVLYEQLPCSPCRRTRPAAARTTACGCTRRRRVRAGRAAACGGGRRRSGRGASVRGTGAWGAVGPCSIERRVPRRGLDGDGAARRASARRAGGGRAHEPHAGARRGPAMKVLHVESGRYLYGGALQVVFLLQGLAKRGGDEHVLACPRGSAIAAAARPHATRVHELALGGDTDVGSLGRLRRLIRAERPDLVHLHSRRGSDLWGGLAARLEGVPAVLSRRVDNPEPRAWAALKYRLYRRVIAISHGIRAVLLAEGLAPERVVCVHSAVDTARYRPGCADPGWLRREFGLSADGAVLAMVAQFIPRKGHRVLLDALPAVWAAHPRTQVLLFGQGPEHAAIAAEVARRGFADRVRLPGFRDDLHQVLPCVDLVVHPAALEGPRRVAAAGGRLRRADRRHARGRHPGGGRGRRERHAGRAGRRTRAGRRDRAAARRPGAAPALRRGRARPGAGALLG
jgi:hypothetical protein